MGITGQDAITIVIAPAYECLLQVDDPRVDLIDCFAAPQPQIGRNLVIATACGVKLSPDVADSLDQRTLDVQMDVLKVDFVFEAALLNNLANGEQGLLNLLALVGGQQTNLGQHLSMGNRSSDVVRV